MNEEDPILICPYNPSHAILRSRMQAHIVKCKQNYPGVEKKVCPFNAIHHVDPPLYEEHCLTCFDRRMVETHLYQMDDGTGDLGITPYHNPDLPEPEENWDDVQITTTYDPTRNLETQPIYRTPMGATKSERKKFRMEERRRHERIMSGEPIDYEPRSSNINRPIRLPRGTSEALKVLETEGASEPDNVARPLRLPHGTSEALQELEEDEEGYEYMD